MLPPPLHITNSGTRLAEGSVTLLKQRNSLNRGQTEHAQRTGTARIRLHQLDRP